MIDIDSKNSILAHRQLINKRKFLNKIYQDFYRIFENINVPKKGLKIEVGSGGGFLKKIIPDVITTDILAVKGIDKKVNLEKLPFKKNSVSAFYMLNVFHHIKNPVKALTEMDRCLADGGKIIMIEPWVSSFSKFIYTNFHHEDFDPQSEWKIKGKGRMSDANGALPWIVFSRDRKKFKKLFPNLKDVNIKPHTPFRYLFSGGLSKPQLLPTSFYPVILLFEKLISPVNKYLGMFATIEVVKSTSGHKQQ